MSKGKIREKSKQEEAGTAQKAEEQGNSQEVVRDEIQEPSSGDQEIKELTRGHEAELQKKLDELNDKYLRLYSEFDNYRKRSVRERLEMSKTASADVIVSLLPVLDDFERALKSMESATEVKAVNEGVRLIYDKFNSILKQKGLERMNCIGNEFNTDFHEAITNIPAPDESLKGRIVDETEKGYLLNGKVIRFARVVVGS